MKSTLTLKLIIPLTSWKFYWFPPSSEAKSRVIIYSFEKKLCLNQHQSSCDSYITSFKWISDRKNIIFARLHNTSYLCLEFRWPHGDLHQLRALVVIVSDKVDSSADESYSHILPQQLLLSGKNGWSPFGLPMQLK